MRAVVERLVAGELVVVVERSEGAGAVVGMAVVMARVESEVERSCPGIWRKEREKGRARQTDG